MLNYKKSYSLLIILILASVGSSFPQGYLRVSGQKIINDVSSNYILKGMGLGGWLVQEGYMLQTGRLDAEHQIRAGIADLVGEQKTEELYQLYQRNYVRKIDIDSMAAWGFNSIRVPLHWNKLISQKSPITYNEEGFKTIDTLLTWCEENEMYLILDLHAAPGGQSAGGISDYDPTQPSLWEDEENKNITVALWRTLAERYSNEEWIGGYDLINEPAWDLGQNAPALRDLYIRITNAIREVDNNHIVFIEGNWYATTFDGLMPPWDDNLVYSFHKYWNQTDQGTIQYLLGFRNTYNRPLWLGETGENSNDWFRETVELMANNNIGWAWWPHKKIDNMSAPLSAPKVEGYQQLLNYWNGSGSRPSDQYAYTVLVNQFNALKFENCIVQSEVHKALLEPQPSVSSPFVDHEIPGTIFGSDYDLGGQRVGYYDLDYKNTDGGAYNSGWAYRNNGVDLENCSDFKRNGYSVGWIQSGEWLKFTVNIVDSGYYKMDFRFASTSSNGIIILDVDTKNLFNMNIPNSGGWANWETVSKDSVLLPAGNHTLLLRFFLTGSSGGFNFNYMEFTSLVTDVDEQNNLPNEYELFQNYPNPFNPTTTIKFNLPQSSKVNLEVFDIVGQKVGDLINGELNAGAHQINFNSANFSSGLYFYKLSANNFVSIKKMILLK